MKLLERQRSTHSVYIAAAFYIAFGLCTRTSAAEEPVKDPAWAHVQFNKGLRENNIGNYAEGLKLLREVWLANHKSYDVASEISRAEGELGHHAIGAKYAAYVLAHLPARESNEFRSDHRNRLNLSLPFIYSAKLTVTPTDLTVTIDGVELDVPADTGLFLEPGRHRVEFKRSGYVTEVREIDARANVQEKLVIELKNEGENATTSVPITPEKPKPTLIAVHQPAPLDEPPPPDTTLSWTILGVGSGLTAIAVGAGVYFHANGSSLQNDAESKAKKVTASGGCYMSPLSSACKSLEQDVSDRKSSFKNAKFLYGTGAVLGVTTAILTWAFWPSRSSTPPPTQLGAWATPGGAGITAVGRF